MHKFTIYKTNFNKKKPNTHILSLRQIECDDVAQFGALRSPCSTIRGTYSTNSSIQSPRHYFILFSILFFFYFFFLVQSF